MLFNLFNKKNTAPEPLPNGHRIRVIKGTGPKNLPKSPWSQDKPPGGELPKKAETPADCEPE